MGSPTEKTHAWDPSKLAATKQQTAFDFWAPVYTADDGTLYSPGFVGNTYAVSAWDKIYFGKDATPGVAEVVVSRERAVDVKKAAGRDGATTTIHGVPPARIQIRVTIWTPEQLKALQALWPRLMVPPYKTQVETTTTTVYSSNAGTTTATSSGSTTTIPAATTTTKKTTKKVKTAVNFQAQHPALKLHGIKAVQILGATGPDPSPVKRARVFTIHAIEYLPGGKKDVTNTPRGSQVSRSTLLDPGAYPTPGSSTSNTDP